MLNWLRIRGARRQTATDLYGVVVARAREPVFYRDMGISDTPEGRYELIVLHLVLLLERLRAEGPAGVPLSREVIETFVADMDGSMREMGVGDLSVPKKVKQAAAGLYERADAFRAAMRPVAGKGALEDAIARLTLGAVGTDRRAGSLAHYYRDMSAGLAAVSSADVLAGRVPFSSLPLPPPG